MRSVDSSLIILKSRYLDAERTGREWDLKDTRVHVLLYFISPYGHGLKPLDLEVMGKLSTKVNIVPIIAKSDSLTKAEIMTLKARILKELGAAGIRIYQLPNVDSNEDEEYKDQVDQLRSYVPYTVCGANALVEVRGKKIRARQYPWGTVEVENPDHCDFVKLRLMLVTHMEGLQYVTHHLHHQTYAANAALQPFQRKAEEMKKRRESNKSNFNNNFFM